MITNAQPGRAERLDADLKHRIMAAARTTPSGIRADARSDERAVVRTAVAVSLGLFFAFDGPAHSAGRPLWFVATSFGIWAAVAIVAARGAWRYAGSFVPGSGMQLATIAVGTPALLLAASLALARLPPGSLRIAPASSAFPCVALTFAAAVYPLVGLSLLRRSTDPLHPVASGAALGASCGAAAGGMVDLWCPVTDALHVLSAHVLPVLALVVLGGLLGDRLLSMRVRTTRVTIAARPAPFPPAGSNNNGIAKPFSSCDVNPWGGRGAADRSRRLRAAARKARAEEGIMIPDLWGIATTIGGRRRRRRAPDER